MKQIFYIFLFLAIVSCGKNVILPRPVIALKNQNFVYRGIDNVLEIVVPRAKSFIVSAQGLNDRGLGKYSWNVTEIKTNTAILDFDIITKNDSVFHFKKEFYINPVPKLIGTLNNHGCEKCVVELTKNDVKDTKLGIRFDNYNDTRYPYFYVKQYTLIFPEGYEYTVYQDTFSDSLQKMILQYPVGTIFKITDVIYNFHGYGPPKVELKFMLVEKY